MVVAVNQRSPFTPSDFIRFVAQWGTFEKAVCHPRYACGMFQNPANNMSCFDYLAYKGYRVAVLHVCERETPLLSMFVINVRIGAESPFSEQRGYPCG